jgi:hypothetical protein
MANNADVEVTGHRDKIAQWLLIFSVFGVTLLATVVVIIKHDEATHVMTAVLPLLGSWVGTVLAFYFSKDNFAAATKSVSDLARQITSQEKLATTLARDKMIPRDKMFILDSPDTEKLKVILEKLKADNKGARIPFVGNNDVPRYIIHRSVIDQFLADKAIAGATNLGDLTLEDLLKDPDIKKKLEQGFATVKEDATLADVKKAMDISPDCQDVFVTKGGSKNEPILGWITNGIIEDNSKV